MIRGHLQILTQMLTYSSRMITNSFRINTFFVLVYHYYFSVVAQRVVVRTTDAAKLIFKP